MTRAADRLIVHETTIHVAPPDHLQSRGEFGLLFHLGIFTSSQPGGWNTGKQPTLTTTKHSWAVGMNRHSNRHAPLTGSASCVQNFDDSLSFAIRMTYRISLRSSSLWEPRHPLLKVFVDVTSVASLVKERRLIKFVTRCLVFIALCYKWIKRFEMGTQTFIHKSENLQITILAPKSGKFTGLTAPNTKTNSYEPLIQCPDWYVEVW